MLRVLAFLGLTILTACASGGKRSSHDVPAAPAAAPEMRSERAAAVARAASPGQPSEEGGPLLSDAPASSATVAGSDLDAAPAKPASSWDFYRERYDADKDGSITPAEYTRSDLGFMHLDVDRDDVITVKDFAHRWDDMPRSGSRRHFNYGQGGPRFGAPAPEFRLTSTTGEEIDLARFRGQKPVVLVFGSFT